jgi:hypothetical protein
VIKKRRQEGSKRPYESGAIKLSGCTLGEQIEGRSAGMRLVRLDAKRTRPDASRPGAPNQIASLRLHLLEHQTHRKYQMQKIIFADVPYELKLYMPPR